MRIQCPVALCGWEGDPHDFHKHIEAYKERIGDQTAGGYPISESHERWVSYFFRGKWNAHLPERTNWTNIAVAYAKQIREQERNAKMQKQKHRLSPDGSDKIEMHDGKVFMNGKEYTPEEFSKVMPGIKAAQPEKHPTVTRDITGELRIEGMTVDEYRKERGKAHL